MFDLIFSKKYLFVHYSRLTPEQKALMLSYAELDKDIEGTINELTQTKSGKKDYLILYEIV
jgi:hypothetical protein